MSQDVNKPGRSKQPANSRKPNKAHTYRERYAFVPRGNNRKNQASLLEERSRDFLFLLQPMSQRQSSRNANRSLRASSAMQDMISTSGSTPELDRELVKKIQKCASFSQADVTLKQYLKDFNALHVALFLERLLEIKLALSSSQGSSDNDTAQDSLSADAKNNLLSFAVVQMKYMTPKQVVCVAKAAVGLMFVDQPLWSTILTVTEAKIQSFSGSELAFVLHSMASIDFVPHILWLTKAEYQVHKYLSSMQPAEVVSFLWALGLCGYRIESTFAKDALQILRQALSAHSLDAKTLVKAIIAIALLGPEALPGARWLALFVSEFASVALERVAGGASVDVVAALATLQHRPPDAWLYLVLDRVLPGQESAAATELPGPPQVGQNAVLAAAVLPPTEYQDSADEALIGQVLRQPTTAFQNFTQSTSFAADSMLLGDEGEETGWFEGDLDSDADLDRGSSSTGASTRDSVDEAEQKSTVGIVATQLYSRKGVAFGNDKGRDYIDGQEGRVDNSQYSKTDDEGGINGEKGRQSSSDDFEIRSQDKYDDDKNTPASHDPEVDDTDELLSGGPSTVNHRVPHVDFMMSDAPDSSGTAAFTDTWAMVSMKELLGEASTPLSARHPAVLVWALEAMGYRPPEDLLQRLVKLAAAFSHNMAPHHIADFLYGLGGLGYQPEEQFLEILLARMAGMMHEADEAVLARVLLSLARLDYRPSDEWLSSAAHAFDARLAEYGFTPPDADAAEDPAALLPPLPSSSGLTLAQQVSDVVASLAFLDFKPEQQLLERCISAVGAEEMKLMESHRFANLLWGLAALNHKAPLPWLDAYLSCLARRLGTLRTRDLANVMWALARLRHRPAMVQLAAVEDETLARLPLGAPADLLDLGWALAQFKYALNLAWIDAWAEALERQVGSMTEDQITVFAYCLKVFRRKRRIK